MIRQSLYELEANHAKIRQEYVALCFFALVIHANIICAFRYETEIARLRRELESRGGPSSSAPSGAAAALNNPSSPSDLHRPGEDRPPFGMTLPGPTLNGLDAGRCEFVEFGKLSVC